MKDSKLWIAAGVAAGVGLLLLAKVLKPGVDVDPGFNRARLVDVVQVQQQPLAPEAQGFGRVSAKVNWQALSEVGGEVIYRHPDLYAGRLLLKGTELLRIDPLEYQLKLAQAQADRSSAQAQLTRVDQSQSNLKSSLELEQSRLKLVQAETKRKQQLFQQNLISDSELDTQQTSLLAQRNVVQDLQNQLALVPDDRLVAVAQLKVASAAVNDAERRLAKTVFTLPFDGRIGDVNIEQAQVVSAGQVLFEAQGMDIMEVEAQVAMHEFRTLAAGFTAAPVPGKFQVSDLNLAASIEVESGQWSSRWDATVTGIRQNIDPNQATVGVVLEIAQDWSQLDLTERPPLSQDLFVRTTIVGAPQTVLTVPARALRQSSLYLLKQGKLAITPVEILFRSGDVVAVVGSNEGALTAGDTVVMNDLIPAIDGMALRTTTAQESQP
ncbi:efflux RND transporter periplasmic adaptor subunit [Ferrimonas lipolytica]|uniref:HlyD family efflux transporter periplasmic adaptor subunit n=1 Tax=Ferrimonas lipolytica TaxID=2724191 RepID=A0A6H1UA76_9GAMM|nr:HlyD family efflux transporter periplasmic adaptor subunit [Ferrimonas lipolytica]QIZ75728.1 HlyD family efflux transporter periplasmic adaptor subunit [Ferrimonas lipolytica]